MVFLASGEREIEPFGEWGLVDPGSGVRPGSSGGFEDIAVPGKVHDKSPKWRLFNLRGFSCPCKGLVVPRQQKEGS